VNHRPARTSRLRRAAVLAATAGLGAAALTALPAAAAQDSVKAQYRTSAPGATADQSEPWFKLVNTGSTAVPLSRLTIRYYFKADAADAQYRFACSWAVPGCATVTGTFGTLANPTATADRYLEIGFTSGTLAAGADTGDLQLRFYRSTWQTLTQSDDYSFNGAQTAYADWSKVTVQEDGAVIWGTAPAGNAPSPSPTATATGNPTPGQALFDDFSYSSSADSRLAQRGWTVKTGAGGPGVPGATWSANALTFPSTGGGQVLQLDSSTDGTGAGTTQAELYQQRKFLSGTYAARVQFSDAPVSGGPDGDNVVQTFFTITPLAHDMDPDYGELDFEYLPNGGWGVQGNILYTTSWETYQNDPWNAVNTHTEQAWSYAGWHDLVIQVGDGHMKYYIDGELFADHGGIYYPETPMSVNFNQWFISGGLQGASTPRTYREQVDYLYFAKDQVLTPAQVQAQVAAYRATSVSFTDTVPAP